MNSPDPGLPLNLPRSQGTIDVHAHFLPPVYVDALKVAGLTTLDGGIPVPQWSQERALGLMDDLGIAGVKRFDFTVFRRLDFAGDFVGQSLYR